MEEKKRRGRPRKQPISDLPVNAPTAEEVLAFIAQEEAAIAAGNEPLVPEDVLEDIVLDYCPLPIWRKELHPIMDEYRFVVLVAHRRFGKTIGLVNHIVKMALECNEKMPKYAYICPWKAQAKMVAWEPLIQATKDIPGIYVNKQEMYIEFPTKYPGLAGARIYVTGSDHCDILRGNGFDAVILDEYAQMPGNIFTEIIQPALTNPGRTPGKCFFIGTPKGENALFEVYHKAVAAMAKESNAKSKRWYAKLYDVYTSGRLSNEEINFLQEDLPDVEFRQEYMCDFTVSVYNAVIPMDIIQKSAETTLTEKDRVKDNPGIMGVDIARFGDDRTTIWYRQGLFCDKPKVYKGLDTMEVADQILVAMMHYKPDAVFIDGGNMGAGVIDRLKQLGCKNIFEVPFGSAAMNRERYGNIRAEMYFKAKEWMEHGGAIPNMSELKTELSKVEYKFDKRSRILLEPKDEVKKKTGKSPDLADGFVLTFAKPVQPKRRWGPEKQFDKDKGMCNTEYSIMGLFEAG